jgi:hypothetical protein
LVALLGLTVDVVGRVLKSDRADHRERMEAADRVWRWSGSLNDEAVQVQVQASLADLSDEQLAERIKALKERL